MVHYGIELVFLIRVTTEDSYFVLDGVRIYPRKGQPSPELGVGKFSHGCCCYLLLPPPKVKGYVFAGVGRYLGACEQLPGTTSSPIVTKLIPLATGDELIKFWKIKVKGQGRWGGMHSTERPSRSSQQLLSFCCYTAATSAAQ